MQVRIADSFTDSLARLTGEEQKAAKTTAFDLQIDPSSPGMSFHQLDRAKDKRFWSVRVSRDVRLIVHKSESSLLLCYVDHHDKAYEWAERRKLEVHPKTGAAQFVEIRERVEEIVTPVYVPSVAEPTVDSVPLFDQVPDEQLLGYGVPQEWLDDVKAATEDSLLALADHLPAEAAEALLELATGGKPAVPEPVPATDPFDHPDALRRFRVMKDVEELERALEFPWEKWTIFLHPLQKQWVEKDYNGPARVGGSAGTGKTVVALHRAAHLARRSPDARVLLTTYSETLASALQVKLRRLLGNEPRLGERIDVFSFDAIGIRLHKAHVGPVNLVDRQTLRGLLESASVQVPEHRFQMRFLVDEWGHVVDDWQLKTWEDYRDVARLGRKTRLAEAQRQKLWAIFERVLEGLKDRGVKTRAQMFGDLTESLRRSGKVIFDFAVVDEAQDISVAQMRFLAALGNNRADSLFFAGDLGQRIFQQPFSWKSLGVDVRGRSRTLRVNYRTSHQIRTQADRLLGPAVTDADGIVEERRGVVSIFNGPNSVIETFDNEKAEITAVSTWLKQMAEEGVKPHEVGVFVRSDNEIDRARAAVESAGLAFVVLDEDVNTRSGQVSIGTMHLAKGLEFRKVVVMACDDEVIPHQERIEAVGDEADLQEVYDTERYLLYVACTRARDQLFVSGVRPSSEFLDDLLI